jgi:hypothetical protein
LICSWIGSSAPFLLGTVSEIFTHLMVGFLRSALPIASTQANVAQHNADPCLCPEPGSTLQFRCSSGTELRMQSDWLEQLPIIIIYELGRLRFSCSIRKEAESACDRLINGRTPWLLCIPSPPSRIMNGHGECCEATVIGLPLLLAEDYVIAFLQGWRKRRR